jgi:hypothetical protein
MTLGSDDRIRVPSPAAMTRTVGAPLTFGIVEAGGVKRALGPLAEQAADRREHSRRVRFATTIGPRPAGDLDEFRVSPLRDRAFTFVLTNPLSNRHVGHAVLAPGGQITDCINLSQQLVMGRACDLAEMKLRSAD